MNTDSRKNVTKVETQKKIMDLEQQENELHSKVLAAAMSESLFRKKLTEEEVKYLELIDKNPQKYILANIFHKLGKNVE